VHCAAVIPAIASGVGEHSASLEADGEGDGAAEDEAAGEAEAAASPVAAGDEGTGVLALDAHPATISKQTTEKTHLPGELMPHLPHLYRFPLGLRV
jgi:hypothetical protein